MKTLWILAAAATFAACHNRSEETGAAPERGDTTAVKSGYDTTQTTPTTPADTGMKTDTTNQTVPNQPPADTTNRTVPENPPSYDTTSTTVPPSAGYDTTSTAVPPSANPAPAPGATTDTTMPSMGNDSTMQHDSTTTPQ